MLESERKKDILVNLRSIHQRGSILSAIDKYDLRLVDFLSGIKNLTKLSEEDSQVLESATAEIDIEKITERTKRADKTSEIFGVIGSLASIVAFIVYFLSETTLADSLSVFFKNNQQLLQIILGITASIVASAITFIISYTSRKKSKKKVKESK